MTIFFSRIRYLLLNMDMYFAGSRIGLCSYIDQSKKLILINITAKYCSRRHCHKVRLCQTFHGCSAFWLCSPLWAHMQSYQWGSVVHSPVPLQGPGRGTNLEVHVSRVHCNGKWEVHFIFLLHYMFNLFKIYTVNDIKTDHKLTASCLMLEISQGGNRGKWKT